MAVAATRPTVTTTAGVIAANTGQPGDADSFTQSFWLQNVTATAIVYIGDATVTSSNGAQWDATKGLLSIDLEPGESLYGIVAAAQPTQTLHVLKSGR